MEGVPRQKQHFREGSHCDLQLLEETGNGRDINRHYYSLEEARGALDKPVVKALLDLCRFRNTHPAFGGEVGPFSKPKGPFPPQSHLTAYQQQMLFTWWRSTGA